MSSFMLMALLSVSADVCSDGGSGASACGSSGACPAVATGGACLQGGELHYPPPPTVHPPAPPPSTLDPLLSTLQPLISTFYSLPSSL